MISVDPNNGPSIAVTGVVIRGANFAGLSQVFLGNNLLANVSRVSALELLAEVPANLPPGLYSLRVCNPDGACGELFAAYTVTGNAPILQAVAPNQGYNDIPNQITLYGFNFQNGLSVILGSQPLTDVVWVNSTQVRAVIPAGLLAGTYDLSVRNPGMAEPSTLRDAYSVLTIAGDDFATSTEDLWTDPPTVYQNETVKLGLNVYRRGGKSTRQIAVAFYRQDPSGARQLIGRQQSAPIPPGPLTVEPVFIAWDTTGLAGAVQIVAVIENGDPETTTGNNQVSRYLTLLSPDVTTDRTPPVVSQLLINNGAPQTTAVEVEVRMDASDQPSGPVALMYLVEREFNAAARQWVAVQQRGWVPYRPLVAWTLTGRGGVRFIQAWVSDPAGNISEATIKTRIDYVPPTDSVRASEVRLYRRYITAGQQVSINLQTRSGDADLYVWSPDGNNSVVSNLEATALDTVNFIAAQTGDYQIEVYGYLASTYSMSVVVNTANRRGHVETVGSHALAPTKEVRNRPIIAPDNEPVVRSAVPTAPLMRFFLAYLPLVPR